MGLHSAKGGTSAMHASYRWSVANQAARFGLTVAAGDKGKVAYQTDTNAFWTLIDDTNVGNPAGWQLSTGPLTVSLNNAIAISGANFVHNIPCASGGTSYIRVQATIKDTTNTKRRRLRGVAVVDGAAGTAVLLGTPTWSVLDDSGSIYATTDENKDATTMLYGGLSVSAGNLVFTVTASGASAQDVNVRSFLEGFEPDPA